MNTFLNKLKKKRCDEVEEQYSPVYSQTSRWMKKLKINSPGKISITSLSPSQASTSKVKNSCELKNERPQSPSTPTNDTPDLQVIVHDFAQGYSSPRKSDKDNDSPSKSQTFVKRMVAAFELKYNGRRSPKATKIDGQHKPSSVNANDDFEIHQPNPPATNYSPRKLNPTPKHFKPRQKRQSKHQRCKSSERLSDSPERAAYFNDGACLDMTECTFEIEEGSSSRNENNKIPLPRNKHRTAVGFDETIIMHSCERSDSSMKREKAPKIVGAFLKKPIEVEETEVNWIPIANQKLPRKSSFKKLLSLLTGKKSNSNNKDNKSSGPPHQCKLPKNPKECQPDSGYDDKSSSSSSLTSKASANDAPQRHNATYTIEESCSGKRTKRVSTFQSSPEGDINEKFKRDINALDGDAQGAKKVKFEEIPRSDIRLSLGPFYPTKEKVIKSLNIRDTNIRAAMRECEELPELIIPRVNYVNIDNVDCGPPLIHPLSSRRTYSSGLRKHPFVSQQSICTNSSGSGRLPLSNRSSTTSADEYYQNDLKNTPSWKFPSDIIYDTPRDYMSTSHPDLVVIRDKSKKHSTDFPDITYDIPQVAIPPRPKSSVYEDALSLKRRTADFGSSSTAGQSNFYTRPDDLYHSYATVKSRNAKLLPSQELLKSMEDSSDYQLRVPYLVNKAQRLSTMF